MLSSILLLLCVPFTFGSTDAEETCNSQDNCNSPQSQSSQTAAASANIDIALRRFPSYGTAEFDELCPWTKRLLDEKGYYEGKCIFLVRPSVQANEGLAEWVTDVSAAVVFAAQLYCHVAFDYGPNVDIQKLLSFVDDTPAKNWTVPEKFLDTKECKGHLATRNCHLTTNNLNEKRLKYIATAARRDGTEYIYPIPLPSFRFQYHNGPTYDKDLHERVENEHETLPGFLFETGMACALGSAMKLATDNISDYIPSLKGIMKQMSDEDALVISIYLRTGLTDKVAKHERLLSEGKDVGEPPRDSAALRGLHQSAVRCALEIEKDWLLRPQHSHKKRVVWLVTSDSLQLAGEVVRIYHDQEVKHSIMRSVLTTGARGIHSRQGRKPKTDEFAEALVDWWLLGESDVVVTHSSYSFVHTAALRTARPIYKALLGGQCSRLMLPSFEEDSNFPYYDYRNTD